LRSCFSCSLYPIVVRTPALTPLRSRLTFFFFFLLTSPLYFLPLLYQGSPGDALFCFRRQAIVASYCVDDVITPVASADRTSFPFPTRPLFLLKVPVYCFVMDWRFLPRWSVSVFFLSLNSPVLVLTPNSSNQPPYLFLLPSPGKVSVNPFLQPPLCFLIHFSLFHRGAWTSSSVRLYYFVHFLLLFFSFLTCSFFGLSEPLPQAFSFSALPTIAISC